MPDNNKETPIKISVFLDKETHKAAKVAAIEEGVSLSRYVSALVAKSLEKPTRRTKQS